MTALNRALADYVNTVTAGTSSTRLLVRLRDVQRRNGQYFVIAAGMLLAMFAIALGLIATGTIGTSGSTSVLSIFGISMIGMVRVMLGLWREKVATEMLIEIADLDDGVLRQVVAKLLTRLK